MAARGPLYLNGDKPMLQYLAAFPNGGGGPVDQVFTEDAEVIGAFIAKHDQPGFSVYRCINPLKPGSRRRCKDTILHIERVCVDLDFKSIEESPEEIERILLTTLSGVLEPTSVVRSGGGLHVKWELKEPVEPDDPTIVRAWSYLIDLLGGDRAISHAAALLREEGTHNTKRGEPGVLVEALWGSGNTVDITGFADLEDKLGARPLLTRREKAPGSIGTKDEPFDADRALASMTNGNVHDTQVKTMASLISSGVGWLEARDAVLAATRERASEEEKRTWDWSKEDHDILRCGADWISKHPQYADRLPDNLRKSFQDKLVAGCEPFICFAAGYGWHVRSKRGHAANHTAGAANTQGVGLAGVGDNSRNGYFILRPFTAFDIASLPPREWIYGRHYQRQTVSATFAPGGTGKSSLSMIEMVAMATGRSLVGVEITERVKTWYHNGEDSMKDLQRRLAAICTKYKVPMSELEGWFFMTSGNEVPLRVADGYSNFKLDDELIRKIRSDIELADIGAATFDPLITLHAVPEQDNTKMDYVVRTFSSAADNLNCAIDLVHHTRKKPAGDSSELDADDARGASSVVNAVRAARVLVHMTDREADDLLIPDFERQSYFKVKSAKRNNAPPGPPSWYHLTNVDLPNGDGIGVIEQWSMPGEGRPTPMKEEADQKAEHVFLAILDRLTLAGRHLNDTSGPNYAPKVMAEEAEAKLAKVSKRALVEAMRRLFAKGKLQVEETGSGARMRRSVRRT